MRQKNCPFVTTRANKAAVAAAYFCTAEGTKKMAKKHVTHEGIAFVRAILARARMNKGRS